MDVEDLEDKKIFFIGIKGTGMSGLALLFKARGAYVSGSDTEEVFRTDRLLANAYIEVKRFDPMNIEPDINFVVYSSAYNSSHPERAKAKEMEIREFSYGEALAKYASRKKTIVISGTHGKTTTTALIGVIFESGGLDPAVLAGDIIINWDNSVRSGAGDFFIVEGDEYQGKLKMFKPVAVVIPSLDWDHPDYFKTEEDYVTFFKDFLKENPQAVLITRNKIAKKLGREAINYEETDEEIFNRSDFILPGEAYKSDALLAIRSARKFGIEPHKIVLGLNKFRGVGRRLEQFSRPDDPFFIIYDYAHHPAEIKATLDALAEKYAQHDIVAIFQPHTYSRTRTFMEDFAISFNMARAVFFDEICASAREGSNVADLLGELTALTKRHHNNVYRLKDLSQAAFLRIVAKYPKPLLIFMGAGDIWKKAESLSRSLFGK